MFDLTQLLQNGDTVAVTNEVKGSIELKTVKSVRDVTIVMTDGSSYKSDGCGHDFETEIFMDITMLAEITSDLKNKDGFENFTKTMNEVKSAIETALS